MRNELDRSALLSGIGFCMIGLMLFSGILLLRYSISPLVDTLGAADTVVGVALIVHGLFKMRAALRGAV